MPILASTALTPITSDPPISAETQQTSSPLSIHPPIPSTLTLSPTTTLTSLTVISSSKIRSKVTQVLSSLLPPPTQPATPQDKSTDTSSLSSTIIQPKIQEASSTSHSTVKRIVRLSAKSNVASKLITVVEIVKREVNVTKDEGATERVWQYSCLHGISTPIPMKEQQRPTTGSKNKKRKRGAASPITSSAAGSASTGPVRKRVCDKADDSLAGLESGGETHEAEGEDDADFFESMPPLLSGQRREDRERERRARELIDELDGSGKRKEAERLTPVLTIYLCLERVKALEETYGIG